MVFAIRAVVFYFKNKFCSNIFNKKRRTYLKSFIDYLRPEFNLNNV
jgi:hypothetical protein